MFIPHDHEKLIGSLRYFSVIVEGKNDKKALQCIELDNIFVIGGKSIEKFTSKLPKENKYVVLTDFDREGELKKQKIYRFFETNKIKFNHRLRIKFKEIFKVVKIEELIQISKIKEDVQYGEISSIYNKIFSRSKFYRRRYSRKT